LVGANEMGEGTAHALMVPACERPVIRANTAQGMTAE
jgi:hypothetical protein